MVGACKQPGFTTAQAETVVVVLDAPGATLAGSQVVAGCFGGAAPGATLAGSRTIAERFAQGSTPEDRGRARSATNVNWIAGSDAHFSSQLRKLELKGPGKYALR